MLCQRRLDHERAVRQRRVRPVGGLQLTRDAGLGGGDGRRRAVLAAAALCAAPGTGLAAAPWRGSGTLLWGTLRADPDGGGDDKRRHQIPCVLHCSSRNRVKYIRVCVSAVVGRGSRGMGGSGSGELELLLLELT